jgi:hypothetical protein
MQEVEIALTERGRSLFEDLFANDTRTISLVVTFMAILELAKLDRILFRQSRAMGPIWVYRKQKAADYELELKNDESMLDTLPEFKPGLVGIVQEQIKQRAVKNALEEALRDLENGILPGDAKPSEATGAAEAAGAEPANGEAISVETASGEADGAALAETPQATTDSPVAGDSDVGQGIAVFPAEAPDPIADAALRELMQRMREASAGEVTSDIPEDED